MPTTPTVRDLPPMAPDVVWTLARARELRRMYRPAGPAHRNLAPAGNLLLTMTQVADELVERFTRNGWRTPVLEYVAALEHLTSAYRQLAVATRAAYVADGEGYNGADPTDDIGGQLWETT
jgi:hypothetical protein